MSSIAKSYIEGKQTPQDSILHWTNHPRLSEVYEDVSVQTLQFETVAGTTTGPVGFVHG
jgi:hypothetical protein